MSFFNKMRRLFAGLCIMAASASPLSASAAAILLVDWNTTNATAYGGGATLNNRTVSSVSTNPSFGNSDQVYAGGWVNMLGTSFDLDSNNDQGYSFALIQSGSVVSITFSSAVTNPYLFFNYLNSTSSTFDFTSLLGSASSALSIESSIGNGSATETSNNVISTSGYSDVSNQGFAIRITGTFTTISFNVSSGLNDTGVFSIGIEGYSVTTTLGANGTATVSGDTLGAGTTTKQVVEASGSETLNYIFSPSANYSLDLTGSSTTCGNTLALNYTTAVIGADCQITAAFALNTYTLGGSITGLAASGLVLTDSNGGDATITSGATSFTLPTAINHGTAYSVSVRTQPTGQTCSVSNGSGTATANVTGIGVSCLVPLSTASPPATPVPLLPLWALSFLCGAAGLLGLHRLRTAGADG